MINLIFFTFSLKYDSIESVELLDKTVAWSTALTKKYPNREFRPIIMNSDGKSVLITRYLRAIRPPEELIENGEDSFETSVILNFFSNRIIKKIV
jgi:hypothetical protein